MWYRNAVLNWGMMVLLLTAAPVLAADGGGPNGKAIAANVSAIVLGELKWQSLAMAATTTNRLLVEPILPLKVLHSAKALRPRPSGLAAGAWLTLTVSQHSAALFDAWSTRKVLVSCKGYERDPLLKPFAGSAAIYPATQVFPAALDLLGIA